MIIVPGVIIPAPADFTSDHYLYTENSENWDPSETSGPQPETPDVGNLEPAFHKEALLEHLNQEYQTPNMDTTDIGFPSTVSSEPSDSGPDHLLNPTPPSPSG